MDIVQAAFSLGASGYVVKVDAGSELMFAVKAVLRGEKFVGSRFAGHGFSGLSDALAGSPQNAFAPAERKDIGVPRRHEAGFYSDERSFLENVTQFIGTALQAGKTAIVAATESHRDKLLPRLQSHGADISAAIEQGRYISLDAADTLSKVMLDGVLDSTGFLECVGNLHVDRARRPRRVNNPVWRFSAKAFSFSGHKATQRRQFRSKDSRIS